MIVCSCKHSADVTFVTVGKAVIFTWVSWHLVHAGPLLPSTWNRPFRRSFSTPVSPRPLAIRPSTILAVHNPPDSMTASSSKPVWVQGAVELPNMLKVFGQLYSAHYSLRDFILNFEVASLIFSGIINSTGLMVSSKLPRFSDLYTLTIASADPESITAKPPVEFTKSVTKWSLSLSLSHEVHCLSKFRPAYRYPCHCLSKPTC